ncbi:MAG TPA: UDP-N-acetylmuramate dehydrogenase, partial [Polyangiaceae bacterium LLY-WYZ-15_(1-7)]|nr:UDP-N-acetylmuramate dehydrogenase [Polyangiaceae bacterium LLY-WYZ-15_(1-7)]
MDDLRHGEPLAPRTTLGLGGPAEHFLEARESTQLEAALRWAKEAAQAVTVLGGGSNAVVPDAGVLGLVLDVATRGLAFAKEGERVRVTAQAGEDWGAFVDRMVEEELAGLECLAGIPGRVGATPIQNVGAYGQEVAETIDRVRVVDRRTGERRELAPEDCAFAYRDSMFKRDLGRWLVLEVDFLLTPGGAPALRYAELEKNAPPVPTLASVKETVVALRRRKSMVLDPADPNTRSAGSFFTNPILPNDEAARAIEAAVRAGVVEAPEAVPRWPVGEARTKLAAGWLIERAGFAKGT